MENKKSTNKKGSPPPLVWVRRTLQSSLPPPAVPKTGRRAVTSWWDWTGTQSWARPGSAGLCTVVCAAPRCTGKSAPSQPTPDQRQWPTPWYAARWDGSWGPARKWARGWHPTNASSKRWCPSGIGIWPKAADPGIVWPWPSSLCSHCYVQCLRINGKKIYGEYRNCFPADRMILQQGLI